MVHKSWVFAVAQWAQFPTNVMTSSSLSCGRATVMEVVSNQRPSNIMTWDGGGGGDLCLASCSPNLSNSACSRLKCCACALGDRYSSKIV